MPFTELATMKEVAKITETVKGGLDRDGGMWTLTRMVTECNQDSRRTVQPKVYIVRQ